MRCPREVTRERVAAAALLLALGACGGGSGASAPPPPPPLQPTLASIQANIFTPTCAVSGCHAGASAMLGLNLEEGQSASHLINVPSFYGNGLVRVVPGDASNSFLIQKLEQSPPTFGDRMPLTGCCLQQVTIDVIRQWIDQGAQP